MPTSFFLSLYKLQDVQSRPYWWEIVVTKNMWTKLEYETKLENIPVSDSLTKLQWIALAMAQLSQINAFKVGLEY